MINYIYNGDVLDYTNMEVYEVVRSKNKEHRKEYHNTVSL